MTATGVVLLLALLLLLLFLLLFLLILRLLLILLRFDELQRMSGCVKIIPLLVAGYNIGGMRETPYHPFNGSGPLLQVTIGYIPYIRRFHAFNETAGKQYIAGGKPHQDIIHRMAGTGIVTGKLYAIYRKTSIVRKYTLRGGMACFSGQGGCQGRADGADMLCLEKCGTAYTVCMPMGYNTE